MEKQQNLKLIIHAKRLMAKDTTAVLKLLNTSDAAKKAGLKIMGNTAVQRWALSNWFTDDELYGIFDDQKLIGIIAIFCNDNNGELGYFIEPVYQNHHIMTRMLSKVLKRTACHTLFAQTAIDNRASQRVLENNHFQKENVELTSVQYRWVNA